MDLIPRLYPATTQMINLQSHEHAHTRVSSLSEMLKRNEAMKFKF